MEAQHSAPVLILGGGINGAVLARELLLNRVPVLLVDKGDIASGATAYSSRLIHGGLRYLEYGEFDLVRESLVERTRWLRLAPQFVQPLELVIPVRNRFGGLVASAGRFIKPLGRLLPRSIDASSSRGLHLVRAGLRLYDAYAKDPRLPQHRVLDSTDPEALPLDPREFPWQCSYFDAQVQYPERFVVALLDDARRIANESGLEFEVFTYHRACRQGSEVYFVPVNGNGQAVRTCQPLAILNATGAWVDGTLQELQIPSKRLIGGTKGSHFITWHESLRKLLCQRGVYTAAPDGRPVFILPLGLGVLVGTTDLPFVGDPHEATATAAELEYLLAAVNAVFPQARLAASDIAWHYSGVRPLPYSDAKSTAAISRRHWLEEHPGGEVPCFSIIGGKLTTCRSLAEQAVATILTRLGLPAIANSQHRALPGAEEYPATVAEIAAAQSEMAQRIGWTVEQIAAAWSLCGTRVGQVASDRSRSPHAEREGYDDRSGPSPGNLDGTHLPLEFARHVIATEWVQTLDDLVDRRLMLLYQPRLTEQCLRQLAELLIEAGRLQPDRAASAVEQTRQRLKQRHGREV